MDDDAGQVTAVFVWAYECPIPFVGFYGLERDAIVIGEVLHDAFCFR